MADRACRECRALISAFIDGEATYEENVRLRQHLATCADCQATLDAYRSIGGQIRALPALHAPIHLTESIYSQTIDAEPRRLFLLTSRLGYSLAAVASVLLIFVVAAYLIIGGYERGVDPAVASSEPANLQTWPMQQAVRIEFNKDMDKDSVEAALGIFPPGEEERLVITWDDNTLVIGANPPFKPDTDYEIKISTEATDKWGNPLKQPFQLGFTTSSSLATLQTPTPESVVTPTQDDPVATEPASVVTEPATATATQEPRDDQPPATTAPSTPSPGPGGPVTGTAVVPNDPVEPTATQTQPRPAATPTPTEQVAIIEPTATPSPTATNTPVPPTATATPTQVAPTATATATATTPIEPTPSPTSDSIPVLGAIGEIYWRDQAVQERLGKPIAAATNVAIDQLDFQRGVMLTNDARDSVYVLKNGGGWEIFGIPSGESPTPEWLEGDIYVPGGTFGLVWRSDPALAETVGYALAEYPIGYTGTVQQFESGRMIATPTTVYVIYNSYTWDWFSHSN